MAAGSASKRTSTSGRRSSGSGASRQRQASRNGSASRRAQSSRSRERSPQKRILGCFTEFQFYALIYLAGIVFLNIVIWSSRSFCDWFSQYVFPIFLNTYGRLTRLFPFSVGEVLIVLGILLCLLAAVLWIFLWIWRKSRNFTGVCRLIRGYYRFFTAVLLNVAMLMTLNCFVLYHCTPIVPNPAHETREYTGEELLTLRNFVVEQANALAEQMERDENGHVVYTGDIQAECRKAMRRLGDTYPKLDGWYTKVKTLHFSDLVSQMYIGGYFFPFSMEANANGNMYLVNYPEVYCHELAHTRGYIYEDEANFLSYLACIGSDDPFLQYSGYLSVISYIEHDCVESLTNGWQADAVDWNEYISKVDLAFLEPGAWERIEENAIISTETVEAVSEKVTDASLKVNGVQSGIVSYSEVVGLLLAYYDGILY